jgi:integrase/recombinase XerD
MTPIAPLITAFLREHMPIERGYSPNTCETYAHAFRLLFEFAAGRLGTRPSQLCVEHITAALVLDFLRHIEKARSNTPVTRNSRLAAVKAFMRYVELRVPSSLEQVHQIRAIPTKRHDQALVQHLTMKQMRAILDAPNLATRLGIRDRAMLHLCFACGLRVSELVELPLEGLSLRHPPSIRVCGKGRRERCLPLWKETATDLRAWLAVRGPVRSSEAVRECCGRSHDAGGVRICPGEARPGRSEEASRPQGTFCLASSAPTQLRSDNASSHSRYSKGCSLVGAQRHAHNRDLSSCRSIRET